MAKAMTKKCAQLRLQEINQIIVDFCADIGDAQMRTDPNWQQARTHIGRAYKELMEASAKLHQSSTS